MERQPSTYNNGLTVLPDKDVVAPDFLVTSTSANDEGVSGGALLLASTADNIEQFSSTSSMELSHIGISTSIPHQNHNESQPKPLLAPPLPLSTLPSPSNTVSFQVTPMLSTEQCGSCGSTVVLVIDYPPSASPSSDSDRNFDAHPHSRPKSQDPDLNQDGILDQYGPNCSPPHDSAEESFQHDQALLAEYIQSDNKLTSQLAFMKTQRKKKHTDYSLVLGYRFIVSLHKKLKTMEFKVCDLYLQVTICSSLSSKDAPHRHVSSRAILAYLDVTPSWLSRAKKVIKLLDKLGPEGTSPDPLVIKRLQSKVVTRKGSDLLTFLKQQDCARKNARTPAVATI